MNIEQRMAQVKQDIARYRQVEKSAELKEFLELKPIVETTAFQAKKKELLETRYRDTEEGKTMRLWNRASRSLITKKYLAIAANETMSKMKLFQKTQAWRQEREVVKNYFRLKPQVEEAEFQKRNAFWADEKRWFKTEECKQDTRYQELAANADIQFYLQQDAKQIAEWESYKTLLEEEFDANSLKGSIWESGFHYQNPALKGNLSYSNEQAAYHEGKNTYTIGGSVKLEVKAEAVQAAAWDEKKGFCMKDFAYTGDVLQCGKQFGMTEGIVLVKARFQGASYGAICLNCGEKVAPIQLAIFDGAKVKAEGKVLDVKPGEWNVYVAKLDKANAGKHSWYPQISAYLPAGAKAAAGSVEVDWIRIYSK